MRPTLALSALLLLLLSPPSLSQSNDTDSATSKTTSTEQSHQNPTAATTISTSTKSTIGVTTTTATLSSAQPNTTQSKDAVNPVQSLTPALTSVAPGSMDIQSGGGPTPTINSTQDDKTKTTLPSTSVPPSSSGQPVSSGGNSSDSVIKAPPSTTGSNQLSSNASSQPPGLLISTTLPPTTTASPRQSMATPSHSTQSHPGGQHSPTTVPSSSASLASTNISVLSRRPTTQIPPGTIEGTRATTSQVTGVPTRTFNTTLQPAKSPVGTQVMATTEELTHSSSDLTSVVPHGPSTSSPAWTFGHYKLKCDPAVMSDEEQLILNLTRASLCERSPLDEKLVELLCHSVKASFKPAQDQCTLEVAPILESQAVAVKRVIIETKLPPKTVFELLKDKWDDLREAGVSDMKLGKEGPPEANEDRFSLPLIITIVCMASFLLLVAALYGCCHQRVSQRKDQQRLTEELQTVENGYHDNPTLEVMETPSEMQEKKVVSLNGELGDSWIVPLDNLTKDDLDEEEDTHL